MVSYICQHLVWIFGMFLYLNILSELSRRKTDIQKPILGQGDNPENTLVKSLS